MQNQNNKQKLKQQSKTTIKRGASQSKAVPIAIPGKVVSDISRGDYVIDHEEMLGTVTNAATAPFLLIGNSASFPGFDLNPGNRVVFPWCSLLATAYEKYRFEKLEFHLLPRNPSTVTGAVYMAVDYDWDDAPATTAVELMSNRGAIASDVWSPATLHVDCRRLNEDLPWRYVADVTRSGTSQRFVYAGFFMIAIAGTNAITSFDLVVKYRLRLSLPALHAIESSNTAGTAAPLTIAAGTSQSFSALPTLTGLAQGISGFSGIPNLLTAGSPCYIIANKSKGTLGLTARPASANAPSTYAVDTQFDGGIYDSAGTLLNYVNAIAATTTYQGNPGPNNAGTWSTAGATARASYTLSFASLRSLLPTAAYLVPYLYSTAGRILTVTSTLDGKFTEL